MSWYQQRSQRRRKQAAGLPSAWRYAGPTSDNSAGSSSVTAAATRVTSERVKRGDREGHDSWQAEAWSLYDQVGELRYVANAIAGRMGSAELYVEKNGKRVDEDDPVLELITDQMIQRLGLNLFVAGSGWLAGLPSSTVQNDDSDGTTITPIVNSPSEESITWVVLSAVEVKRNRTSNEVEIRGVKYDEDHIYLEKIWDPHPAVWEEADSPVRSALPVLRELVGLTQHVSAQIDSRLAGAGVYWIPNSILAGGKVLDAADGAQTTFAENAVLNAIMTAMLLPMEDRSNAAAVVPLLLGGPDDAISKIRFDSFATPFDENTKGLREEAIRRLALNLDAPPELLLGMGGSNHWAAWLVRDEVVQIHVAPRLALVCDALTTGFYRPIMEQLHPGEDSGAYVVKADVSGLVQRPNRLADASQLHAVSVVGDKALREAGGFEEEDAPSSQERAIAVALQVATANPQLLDNMPEIVATVMALLDGTPGTAQDTPSSARVPGTLDPLVPANLGTTPPAVVAPNGSPGQEGTPVGEADSIPSSGPPV